MDEKRYRCLGLKDRQPAVPSDKLMGFLWSKRAGIEGWVEFYLNGELTPTVLESLTTLPFEVAATRCATGMVIKTGWRGDVLPHHCSHCLSGGLHTHLIPSLPSLQDYLAWNELHERVGVAGLAHSEGFLLYRLPRIFIYPQPDELSCFRNEDFLTEYCRRKGFECKKEKNGRLLGNLDMRQRLKLYEAFAQDTNTIVDECGWSDAHRVQCMMQKLFG